MNQQSDNYVSIIPLEPETYFLDQLESRDYNEAISSQSVSVATDRQIFWGFIAACVIIIAGMLLKDHDLNFVSIIGFGVLFVVLRAAIKLLRELAEFLH